MKSKYQGKSKTFSTEEKNFILRSLKSDQIAVYKESEKRKFTLYIQYRNDNKSSYIDKKYEEIKLDGITNAVAIFDLYASMGHSLNLHTLICYDQEDKKLKKLNFKYQIDDMKYKMKIS